MVDSAYVHGLLDLPNPVDLSVEALEAVLDSPEHQFKALNKGDVVEGVIVRIDPDEVLVDIGLKSEGVVSGRELGTAEEVKRLRVGDSIAVAVLAPETTEGHAVLSIRRARQEKSWRFAEQVLQDNEIIEAEVIDFNKGGLIVNVQGLRGFVPISQVLGLRREPSEHVDGEDDINQRLSEMVGRTLSLKVIELVRGRNRLILSERAAVMEARAKNKDQLLEELEVGQVRRGRVSNILPFGVFVDLGGADGLIHISQLSYSHVADPSDLLHIGDEIDVYVMSIDPVKKKIALSLKRAQADPWDTIEERYQIGQIVRATVTKITQFGAFARVEDGVEGLVHVSELSNRHVTNPREVVKEGDILDFQVIGIEGRRRRLGLSLRALEDDQEVYDSSDGAGEAIEAVEEMLEMEGGAESTESTELAASTEPAESDEGRG